MKSNKFRDYSLHSRNIPDIDLSVTVHIGELILFVGELVKLREETLQDRDVLYCDLAVAVQISDHRLGNRFRGRFGGRFGDARRLRGDVVLARGIRRILLRGSDLIALAARASFVLK